jgi:hypothetical protein
VYIQPEDGSKKPKHVAESCKFTKYLIKKVVLDHTVLHYVIGREMHNGHGLP